MTSGDVISGDATSGDATSGDVISGDATSGRACAHDHFRHPLIAPPQIRFELCLYTTLHYITEILLKVALNTIKQTKTYFKISLKILASIVTS